MLPVVPCSIQTSSLHVICFGFSQFLSVYSSLPDDKGILKFFIFQRNLTPTVWPRLTSPRLVSLSLSFFCLILFISYVLVWWVWRCVSMFRHIQDPASQRLTWNTPPKSVLVIKKIRDASLLEPFKELCIFLTEVCSVRSPTLRQWTLLEGNFRTCYRTRLICTIRYIVTNCNQCSKPANSRSKNDWFIGCSHIQCLA